MPRTQMDSSAIHEMLDELSNGVQFPWPRLSHLLDSIDRSGYWDSHSHSFTEWLKQHAPRLHLKESTLWRCLAAGRYYNELREQFSKVKLDYPPLHELPDHVSPEKLELLSKLARVAPREFFEPLMHQVLNNEISRDELRTKWKAFRPALKGRTARGRGTIAPVINPRNKTQYNSVLEAMVINALRANGPAWLGGNKKWMYDIRMHARPDYIQNTPVSRLYEFDAVALVKHSPRSQLEVHGIEVMNPMSVHEQKCIEMAGYCDYFWIAFHAEMPQFLTSPRNSLPRFVGIIEAQEGEIIVHRHAEPCEANQEHRIALLKGLLTKEPRR